MNNKKMALQWLESAFYDILVIEDEGIFDSLDRLYVDYLESGWIIQYQNMPKRKWTEGAYL
ncbi:MAG TPA: hypothetical protein PLI62_07170 [Spirochaetota bacterium]|nr:hypothetical protein [Spirochaetota bacterium]